MKQELEIAAQMGHALARHFPELRGRGHCQVFLALEVMEEGALGEAGRPADVIHRRRRISLRANDMHRRVQEASSGIALARCCAVHTIQYVTYRLVGIE